MKAIEDTLSSSTVASPGATSGGGSPAKPGRKPQSLKHWWLYQTQDDLDFYRNPKQFMASKMVRAVKRANSFG